MRRSSIILGGLLAPIPLIISGNYGIAETFGPYFYRTGDEMSYGRWETTIHLNGSKLVVNECGEQMHLLISQAPRECWTEDFSEGEFVADSASIHFENGDDVTVDRQKRKLMIQDRLDHHDVVRNVTEGFSGWENTPASWQIR